MIVFVGEVFEEHLVQLLSNRMVGMHRKDIKIVIVKKELFVCMCIVKF